MTHTIAISRFVKWNEQKQVYVTQQLNRVKDQDTYYTISTKDHDTPQAAQDYIKASLASGMAQLYIDALEV